MAEWSTREVDVALRRKGFELERSTNHEYYRLYVDGKATAIRTKLSHGNRKINQRSQLFAAIARQLKLKKQELSDLFNCPLSFDGYLTLLRERELNLCQQDSSE